MIISNVIELKVVKRFKGEFENRETHQKLPYFRLYVDAGETIDTLSCSEEAYNAVKENAVNKFRYEVNTANQRFRLAEVVSK